MIRFIHTADVHFGMENYGKIDPVSGIHSRLLDFAHAFDYCIDTAIAEKVDFFLFCGDAYKTAHPSPTQQKFLFKALLRLHEANIPVVIVVGNHDHPLSTGKANSLDLFSELPVTGFHVIAQPKIVRLETNNGPVSILGIPWPTRNSLAINTSFQQRSAQQITEFITHAVTRIITEYAAMLPPTEHAILAGHLTVSTGLFSGSEKRAIYGHDAVFLPSQLAIPPFDYVALGHLHRYQNLNPQNNPPVVYSGSIERIDFGERKEEKGFCLVTLHTKGNTTVAFIPTPTRPFVQIEVTIDPELNQTAQIVEAIARHVIVDAIVKIVYYLPANAKDLIDSKIVQRACMQAQQVIGIFPVRNVVKRERRTISLAIEKDLLTMVDAYCSSKPELQKRKEQLLQKTGALLDEQDIHDANSTFSST